MTAFITRFVCRDILAHQACYTSTYEGLQTRGGTHMLRHTGMCRPNGLLFHQKSLDMGPILVKKILRRGSHFTKIAKKLQNQPFLR